MRGVLSLAVAALAAVGHASITCDQVESQTSIEIHERFDVEYTSEQTKYWSTAAGALKPACIIMPKTVQEVAAIVNILRNNNETFAIKSGGHNPNNYFSSIDGGPLISTKNLNQVILDPATETARIGPGNRWDRVAEQLDGTGYTVVGGRIGDVGVGGFMLGNGLSFMSTEYGWAVNSVIEFEVVLANATIVYVNENNHPDLFMALKGGGNNFGIVTSYLVKAYPQGQIWGGNLIFDATPEVTQKILSATYNFTTKYNDGKAGIIITAERTLATLVDIWVIFLFYNGPTPPPEVFGEFFAVSNFKLNTCKTRSMSDLVSGNNWANLKGSVYTIATETMPMPDEAHGLEVLNAFYDHWVTVSNQVKLVPGLVTSMAFQPAPKRLASIARSKGGDMLDLDPTYDRIVLELDYSYIGNLSSPTVDGVVRETYEGFKTIIEDYQESGVLPQDAFLPLFQNDCFYPQDFFGRLRPEKLALAKSVQNAVDPTRFFHTRTGGFKIPQ
ncbi:FAD binding domain-containing protein [Xylariaceae sp. FL0594]|nr:FAD binding domain-containing protein [Xylariaceae sp. FL0594]